MGKRKSNSKTGDVLPEYVSLDQEQQDAFIEDVKQKKEEVTSGWDEPGVVYLGHIPHGFFEPQIRKYFSQFGRVTGVKLSRSKKTGASKGYAFIKFKEAAVAKIVAETMHNYLMFERLMKCEFIPMDKVHENTFKGTNRAFKKSLSYQISAKRHNSEKSLAKHEKLKQRKIAKTKKSLSKLGEMGIDFEFPGLVKIDGSSEVPGKENAEEPAILYDDSSEDEIKMKTPPNARRKSLTLLPGRVTPARNRDHVLGTKAASEGKPTSNKSKASRSAKKGKFSKEIVSLNSKKDLKVTPKKKAVSKLKSKIKGK